MPRLPIAAMLVAVLALLPAPNPSMAGLLTLSVVEGLQALDGSTTLEDPIAQESLSGSTLTQLGVPLPYDPVLSDEFGITVRITNTSTGEILFPDVLPGVSVLTGVSGVPGYSSRQNVAAGGAANRTGGEGTEGAISRTAIDLLDSLEAISSPVSGSNGGGGGAATGVANNWISITGASGLELAAFLAGVRLAPGAWIDIRDFVRVNAFQRDREGCRIAFGFDLPTFSQSGVSVTSTAWTGSFAEAAPATDPGPVAAAEPPIGALTGAGLAGLAFRRRRRMVLARD